MATIQLRRGDASAWTDANSVLAAGEVGLEMDTGKFKWGDGTTAWNDLAYIGSLPAGFVANTDADGQLRLISSADTAFSVSNGNQPASAQFQNGGVGDAPDTIITFSAVASGLAGELVSVALQGLADDEDLSVSVDGNAVTIVLGTAGGDYTSLASDVADLVNGDPDASAIVSASVDSDGVLTAGSQSLVLPTLFTVGADGLIQAGGLQIDAGDSQIRLGLEGLGMQIGATADQSQDLFRATNEAAGAWGLTKQGLEYFQAFDAGPDDGDVGNGERIQWMDDTSGDPAMKFKMRDVDGNLHVGRSVGLGDDGTIKLPNLPTSDPGVADELWNDAGVLKVSAG